MSIYRKKGSPFYHYDFWRRGRRFLGSTGKTTRREADETERLKKAQADAELRTAAETQAPFRGDAPLTLDIAAGRWWTEVGQHRSDAGDCWHTLEAMVAYFGAGKRLDAITDSDVSEWIAVTRGQRVWKKCALKDGREAPLLSPARVNRRTVDLLRGIFGRAKRNWKLLYANEPNWRAHRLAEPEERVRELAPAEEAAITAAAKPDYERVYRFARLSGLRRAACLIPKSAVKWDQGRIEVRSKGGKLNRVPISDAIAELLREVWDHHPTMVFTYAPARFIPHPDIKHRRIKGERYPITVAGLASQWERDRLRASAVAPSLADYRFHDNRHTAATRILRSSGNLKIAQRLLNHARISTTAKYAHVLDDEVLAAMNATAAPRVKRKRKSG